MEAAKRLKVLVSAYTCSPYRGSEHAVGWGFVQALAKYHDLWVITEEEKCRGDIERYQADNPKALSNVRFYFIRKQRNRKLRKLWPPSYYWYYKRWHQQAFSLAKKLHEEEGFDLAHQLTMVGFREPGYLWRLPIPFVWGPVGGMGLFPWRFLLSIGWYGAFYFAGYNLYNFIQMHFSMRPKRAALVAGSRGLLLATPENWEGARRYWGVEGQVMPEVGLPGQVAQEVQKKQAGEPLKILWSGLHVPGKALNLGLQALGCLNKDVSWELHVLGEGPKTQEWKAMAESLGLADHCHFYGWLPRDRAISVMRKGHLLLITSLRDLTSTVTVEALSLGMPIVCLDHCGFTTVVDDSNGVKVAVTTPREVIKGLAHAVEQLAQDEELRRRLAWGALKRARKFDWDRKGEIVSDLYRARIAAGTRIL